MRYILAEMTWPEVQKALKTVQLAVIPLGAHEQHGPHMKESCDAVLAEEISKRLVERLYPYALMTPTIPFGISIHHIRFPGTITLRPQTLSELLRDVVWSLQYHNLNNFLVVNAHGGNESLLNVVCTTLRLELGARIYYAKTTASAKNAIARYVHSELYGHSCEREVSEALYLAPHLVYTDRLQCGDITPGHWQQLRPGQAVQGFYFYDEMTKNGCLGNATTASYEAGQAIVEEALNNLVATVCTVFDLPVRQDVSENSLT